MKKLILLLFFILTTIIFGQHEGPFKGHRMDSIFTTIYNTIELRSDTLTVKVPAFMKYGARIGDHLTIDNVLIFEPDSAGIPDSLKNLIFDHSGRGSVGMGSFTYNTRNSGLTGVTSLNDFNISEWNEKHGTIGRVVLHLSEPGAYRMAIAGLYGVGYIALFDDASMYSGYNGNFPGGGVTGVLGHSIVSSKNNTDIDYMTTVGSTIWLEDNPFTFTINHYNAFAAGGWNIAGGVNGITIADYYSYYCQPMIWVKADNYYGFYSHQGHTTLNDITNFYHFYGYGDYPSYFGGDIYADGDSIALGDENASINIDGNNKTIKLDADTVLVNGIRKYVALLTQSETSNPTVVILENTIGDIVWTRQNIGSYVGTLAGAFLVDKVGLQKIIILDIVPDGTNIKIESLEMWRGTNNVISVSRQDYTQGHPATTVLDGIPKTYIEIRVYP